jgi:hypothetical protein
MLGTSGVVDKPQRRLRYFQWCRMKANNIATELDVRISVAMSLTAGSTAPLANSVRRLDTIHESLKSQRAAGLLTDKEYAREAGGLLNMLSNLDGLPAEAANGTPQR